MATFVGYTPTSLFTRAMFNFDASGVSNYLISGPIRVSVSDGFSNTDYYLGLVSSTDYTLNPYSNENANVARKSFFYCPIFFLHVFSSSFKNADMLNLLNKIDIKKFSMLQFEFA